MTLRIKLTTVVNLEKVGGGADQHDWNAARDGV